MFLTKNESSFLLEAIAEIFGHGYAPQEATGVGRLQAKLSMMAQASSTPGDSLISIRDWKISKGRIMNVKQMELSTWLKTIGAHIVVSGAIHSPSNTFINVSIKQNASPHDTLVLEKSRGSSLYGRSDGTMERNPKLHDAIIHLLDKIEGKEICFGHDSLVFTVPENLEIDDFTMS